LKTKSPLHAAFEIGVLLKGLDGVAQVIGALLLFVLNMTVDQINALNAPVWQKTLLRAMSVYGMFFVDTGAGGSVSIDYESGNMYTSISQTADPWIDFARSNGWPRTANNDGWYGNLGGFVNWDNLQVVRSCVSEGTARVSS
jgi:hypothetical protein